MNKDMLGLILAFGWIEIPVKNPYMISFTREESRERLNIYPSTMTVTYQSEGGQQKHYYRVDLEALEKIVSK